ncbi:hypothetical protein BpHYR1_013076 [Brachionus plicatilis]|uniref:Uncharacterized protein n=1 Tax=Brachionus plicatilis TaxID=10195 RepID=A0A3M7R7F7_BRAPC|nr:hypothetical protein BpHYR1_013076 [Brachionus plicatilis]
MLSKNYLLPDLLIDSQHKNIKIDIFSLFFNINEHNLENCSPNFLFSKGKRNAEFPQIKESSVTKGFLNKTKQCMFYMTIDW